MIHWLTQIHQLFRARTPFVIATIWSIEGSSPETPGSRLVITAADCFGQLQSSNRQQEIVKQSREILGTQTRWFEKTYSLGPVVGTANGHCTVTFEFFNGLQYPQWLTHLRKARRENRPLVLSIHIQHKGQHLDTTYCVIDNACSPDITRLFNSDSSTRHLVQNHADSKTYLQLLQESELAIAVVGHSAVALALIEQLLLLPAQIYWISDRFEATFPTNQKIRKIQLSEQAFVGLAPHTKVAIATSNHELDIQCCHFALSNPTLSYIGCLGSVKKAEIVKSRLKTLGMTNARLANLAIPIGLDSIPDKQPAIIAASVIAQMLSVPKPG